MTCKKMLFIASYILNLTDLPRDKQYHNLNSSGTTFNKSISMHHRHYKELTFKIRLTMTKISWEDKKTIPFFLAKAILVKQ